MNYSDMNIDNDFTRVDDSYEGGDDLNTSQRFGRRDSAIGKDTDDEASDRSAIDGKG